jgi:hypothetical protein
MRMLVAVGAAIVLAGCGADAASTAVTAASLKKQELQDGQRAMQQTQQKIDSAIQQVQERTADADK